MSNKKNTYKLINPYIQGDFKSSLKANNSINAARHFYKKLSEHFNNNVPVFYLSIQKGSDKYYHFKIKENKNKEEISYSVEPYIIKDQEKLLQSFKGKLNDFKTKFKQAGGKKKKKKHSKKLSSDDDNNSSDDYYVYAQTYKPVVSTPLYYWWYDPLLYNINSVYIPTFYPYVSPYLHYFL